MQLLNYLFKGDSVSMKCVKDLLVAVMVITVLRVQALVERIHEAQFPIGAFPTQREEQHLDCFALLTGTPQLLELEVVLIGQQALDFQEGQNNGDVSVTDEQWKVHTEETQLTVGTAYSHRLQKCLQLSWNYLYREKQ